jgi:hypothetical protein
VARKISSTSFASLVSLAICCLRSGETT